MTSRIEVVGFHGSMLDGETPSLHEPVLARRDGDDWYVVTPDDLDSTDVPCSFEPRNWMGRTKTWNHPYEVGGIVLVLSASDRMALDICGSRWWEVCFRLRVVGERVAYYGPRELLTKQRDLLAADVRERLIALAWRDLALNAEQPTQALLEAYGKIKPGVLVLPPKQDMGDEQ